MASQLPAELLQQICMYSSPLDFAAILQTCLAWRSAALCSRTTQHVANRAGWSSYLAKQANWPSQENLVRQSLSFDTLGKVVPNKVLVSFANLLERETSLIGCQNGGKRPVQHTPANFRQIAALDFTTLESRTGGKHAPNATFSIDTNFLLVTHGANVYIYSVDSRRPEFFLTPLAAIRCPRRVLQATMDASAGRHSVAALLDNRTACICNLEDELVGCSRSCSRLTSDGRTYSLENINTVQVDSTHQSVVLYNASFARDATHGRNIRSSRSSDSADVETTEPS